MYNWWRAKPFLISIYVKGFFMLTKIVLKQFCTYLRRDKYKNVLQELKVEYCTDDDGTPYLHLNVIKIKSRQRSQGWGSKVMSDIINFADKQNVRVELYASNIFGSNVNRLYGFYQRQGFTRIPEDKDGKMLRQPKNILVFV